MAITKTSFINYTRCPRYVGLEKLKKEVLTSNISYEEYQKEIEEGEMSSIIETMVKRTADGEEIDLTETKDISLEAMMKYYNQVEVEAAKVVEKVFGGKTIHAIKTKNQESFDYNHNGVRYLCYVDIVNENEENINIIEVKASTSNAFYELGPKFKGILNPIFAHKDGIDYLKEELFSDLSSEIDLEKYINNRNKLFKRFDDGKYVYDLAVQRMIIEGEYKETNQEHKISKTRYYLAVLNHEYVFDGTYENNEPLYNPDENGREIIRIFDFTKITEEYQQIIKEEQERLENYLFNPNSDPVKLKKYCQRGKSQQCKYFDPVCSNIIPKINSVLTFNGNIYFKNEFGDKYNNKLDLVNEGYLNILDVPEQWINSANHLLQQDVVRKKYVHVNQEKIRLAINQLKYPLYHLDFETFPCPLPRFKGESCYEQSPFEFSLHIEHEPGVCDFNQDNYVYLNKTHNDEREEIAKRLVELIDPDKGMMFAQNFSFEQKVLKKLANNFPEYKEKLLKIAENSFDLLHIVRGNTELFKGLGYDEEEAKSFNYYHEDLQGSFSIKKTLPVFTNLSYDNLIVKNGNEAFITYLQYPTYSESEYRIKYQALVDYCKQDTWAMVEILDALRKLV